MLRPTQGKMNASADLPWRKWGFSLGIPETIGSRERTILNWPEVLEKIRWTPPADDGSVTSSWTTEGVIQYTAKLIPGPDTVDVEMTITNLSDELWHDVFAFNCLNPTAAEPLKDWKLKRTYMSAHGKPLRMDGAKRVKGHMPTVGFFGHEQTPWGVESPFVRGFGATGPRRTDGSWIVTLSEPAGSYMAATTVDSLFLFDNLDRCCIHSAPSFGDIGPGESSTTVCRFYLADGSLEDFLKRAKADRVELDKKQKWARKRRPRIELTPVPTTGKITYGPLAFDMKAPWMNGPIRLRLPETVRSSLGLHFIDHNRRDMPPLGMIRKMDGWKKDPRTGEIAYRAETTEGVSFAARVRPYEDEVCVEFRMTNGTEETIRNGFGQMCLSMRESKDFGQQGDLINSSVWIDGTFTSLAKTTPTAEAKGRTPWLQILTKAAGPYRGPRENKDGWWFIDQKADLGIIARAAADGKHLVAHAWEGAKVVMTNTRIPCLHSAVSRIDTLKPGETGTWRGKIYLMQNDPPALLIRHKGDSGHWPYPRRRRR